MNSLENLQLASPMITGGSIFDANIVASSTNVLTLASHSIINLGQYSITASELANKLQLLDRLIAEYLPEELL